MPEEPLREIIDAMRTRIQAELDTQIQALNARHQEAITRARQDAEAEADKRWGSKIDAVRFEWSARLESEVAAREEAEARLVAEAARVRTELEERLASESTRVRAEAEQAVAAERQRSAEQLEAERRRAVEELQETLATLAAEQVEQEARGRQTADIAPAVLTVTRAISEARSLSDALTQLGRGAAAHSPRAAVFVVNGRRLEEWSVAGIPPLAREPIDLDQGGLLKAAAHSRSCVWVVDDDPERAAPAFTLLPRGRSAVAVPLVVGGQAVAVLYADEGVGAQQWGHGCAEIMELLARHTAACLAHLTAVRSLQVLHGTNGHEVDAASAQDEDRSARRYAKLLISEIKLYNEGAVRVGCQKRDLLQRLKAEIDRARRLYEERVPATVDARQSYFQHELIQTLAGGDSAALGS